MYILNIMFAHEKKINKLFLNWLLVSLILVFSIIIVGGLTRLTNSGLSITEWELFTGILPPLSDNSWLLYFNDYKKIPQFKLINPNMTLNEFKIIFYWEYFHRILGRVIGLFFLIPFLFFYFTNKVEKKYLNLCFLVLLLIIIQGVVGWYMVKSGLVNNVTVSHYRLSMHLCGALIIISTIFWIIINTKFKTFKFFFNFSKKNIIFIILIFLIFIQIIMGAFVSGLDAGRVYQTWPLMGFSYFPEDTVIKSFLSYFNFENHSLVQFYHRNLAYFISLYVCFLGIYIFKKKILRLYIPLSITIFFLFLQILLGIITLTSGLNIYLASAHQVTSVLLVLSTINMYYFYIK